MPAYYGLGLYGTGLYSAVNVYALTTPGIAPSIILSGHLDIAGKVALAGDMGPAVTLAGTLNRLVGLKGGFSVTPTLAASGFGSQNMFADLVPQIDLGASLTVDRAWGGHLPLQVTLAAELASGPLWEPVEPCEAVWVEMETCCA